MGDVRIVACVLDDARRGARSICFADRHGEGRPSPARKLDFRHCGAFACDERLAGGAHGGGGARSRRPAPSQGRAAFVCIMSVVAHAQSWPSGPYIMRFCGTARAYDG